MKAYERFLEYVAVWTTSDENSDTVPSAARELDLAKKLVEEMMEPCDSEWRGLGVIKGSGMRLQEEWSAFDARKIVLFAVRIE